MLFKPPLIRRLMCQTVDAIENRMNRYSLESRCSDTARKSQSTASLQGNAYPKSGPIGTQLPPFKLWVSVENQDSSKATTNLSFPCRIA